MVELTKNLDCNRNGWLKTLDVRFKFISLAVLSLASLNAKFYGLCLLLLTQILVFFASRIPLKKTIKDFRLFFAFLVFIFFTQTFSTQGSDLFQINIFFFDLSVTKDGLINGIMVSFRLFLVVILGYLFLKTTSSFQVRIAVAWFLRPLPLIPEKRIATMLSLLMRFLPLIVQQVGETSDAQRARCIENRKNPIFRFIKLTVPVLRRIFLRTDDLIMAMEARVYSEDRTLRSLYAKQSDWVFLMLVIILTSLLMVL